MTFGGNTKIKEGPVSGIKNFIKNEWQWVSIVFLIVSVAFGVGANYATNTIASKESAAQATQAATAAKGAADKTATTLEKHEEAQITANKELDKRLAGIEKTLNQIVGRIGTGPITMSTDKETLKSATVKMCKDGECK